MIHKTQREVAPQKTHNTKHMQGWVGWWWGGWSHTKKLKAFEDYVYKVTGFGEKAVFQVCNILLL